jgi:hypothetical protein
MAVGLAPFDRKEGWLVEPMRGMKKGWDCICQPDSALDYQMPSWKRSGCKRDLARVRGRRGR